MKDVLALGVSSQNRTVERVEPALLTLAVQLRSRRLDSGRTGFTVVAPAGPGFTSRKVSSRLAAALEQIQEGPVLTVHCEPSGAQNGTSGLSEAFVVTPERTESEPAADSFRLPAPGALPSGTSMQFSREVDVASALTSKAVVEFFERASQTFRHVVLSAGCPQRHPETIVLTNMAHYLVMTVMSGHTTQSEMREALALFRASRAETMGFLMENGRPPERPA